MTDYVAAFLLTLAVEIPLYAVTLRALLGVPPKQGAMYGALVNACSHVLAFKVLFPVTGASFGAIAAIEAFVVFLEAGFLRVVFRRDLPLLVGLSFLVNAASLGLGALLLR